jgi:hypothetical protein
MRVVQTLSARITSPYQTRHPLAVRMRLEIPSPQFVHLNAQLKVANLSIQLSCGRILSSVDAN